MEELTQRLVSWIREQVASANSRGVVVGMSGGLDSSVAAVLCHRAFPDNMLGVLLPCHSSEQDLEDARLIAQRFHIPTLTVALGAAFDALQQALPSEGFDADTSRLAEANLKPRLRMIALYYLANRMCYLVVGTSNRSELAIGYFTKYGDGSTDILPLGNLVKGQVRELGRYLGIPEQIIGKPPSAGLWPGQTDEQEIGLSYEALDRYLVSGEAAEEVRRRVEALIQASNHKRRTPPIPPF